MRRSVDSLFSVKSDQVTIRIVLRIHPQTALAIGGLVAEYAAVRLQIGEE